MAPGLTSAGGRLPDSAKDEPQLAEGDVVVVEAEGKEEACMVGRLKMGTEQIREKKKGIVMDGGHFLGDGLWRLVVD